MQIPLAAALMTHIFGALQDRKAQQRPEAWAPKKKGSAETFAAAEAKRARRMERNKRINA